MEFEAFGGPILAHNCVLIPNPAINTYRTLTPRASPRCQLRRITTNDFSEVIKRALEIGPLKPTGW